MRTIKNRQQLLIVVGSVLATSLVVAALLILRESPVPFFNDEKSTSVAISSQQSLASNVPQSVAAANTSAASNPPADKPSNESIPSNKCDNAKKQTLESIRKSNLAAEEAYHQSQITSLTGMLRSITNSVTKALDKENARHESELKRIENDFQNKLNQTNCR